MVGLNESCSNNFRVFFIIELRKRNDEQIQAGRRLFSKLLERARSENNSDQLESAVGTAGETAEPSPAPAPHSLSGGQKLQEKSENKESQK